MSIFRKKREFDGLFKEQGHRLEWLGPAESFLEDLPRRTVLDGRSQDYNAWVRSGE